MKIKYQNGFTLIEVMLVITIIGIIAGISTVSSHDMRARFKLKSAALTLQSDLQLARLGAIRDGKLRAVCFNAEGVFTSYVVRQEVPGTVICANGIIIKTVDLTKEPVRFTENFSSGNQITFDPRGSASPGNISLESSNAALGTGQQIIVNGLTGNIRVDKFNLP